MKVILFGASGMVGQGVLLACLRDPGSPQPGLATADINAVAARAAAAPAS
jgi:hypothetical protein